MLGAVEGDREGLEPGRGHRRGDRRDDRAVETTGEIGADRHVGAHAQARGVLEQGAQLLARRGLVAVGGRGLGIGVVERPPRPQPHAGGVDQSRLGGLQLEHVAERRARGDRRPQGEDLIERGLVEDGLDAGHLQERLDLGGEGEGAADAGPVERAHAHAVAGHEQGAAAGIEDDEGEVAVEQRQEVLTVDVPQMKQHLGVAGSSEAAAARLEIAAQLDPVEDLAVEGDGRAAVGEGHGLAAVAEADDRQAGMAEAAAVGDEVAVLVGAAMPDGAHHAHEKGLARSAAGGVTEIACESAHERPSGSKSS